jgi:DNA-binding IclR family transcriptional regulator
LAYEGYLVRRSNGIYALGMEIASRFRDLVASMPRPPQIHDVLRQLAEVTGHTAYFAQLVDGRVVLTDLVEGPHSPHLEDLVVGFDEGAHATALGKALLSTIPVTQRKALLQEQGLRPFTSNTITDAGQLHHEIAVSARFGIFTEEQQYRPEVCCAAVLVGENQDGAIGISGGAHRWSQLSRALVQQLLSRAGDLNVPGLAAEA